jgi:DNA mismatch repair protein MutS
MVEMTEVANILQNATSNSLLILDEIGRGTSTFDGLSIAWAVIEHISNPKLIGAKTLFATHYHELTELEGKLDGVNNYCIAAKEQGEDVVFLRKIQRGGADKSYGIHVAKLAGVPESVIRRANQLAEELSNADIAVHFSPASPKEAAGISQAAPIHPEEADVVKELKDLDLGDLTPRDCMNILYRLQARLLSQNPDL